MLCNLSCIVKNVSCVPNLTKAVVCISLVSTVDIMTIQQSFEELGHQTGSWDPLTCADLFTLLIDIFRHTHGKELRMEELEMLSDLTLNLLLNLFDK